MNLNAAVRNGLSRLTERQKTTMSSIIHRVLRGQKIAQNELGLLGHTWDEASRETVRYVFGCTGETLARWEARGMPVNGDGTYCIRDCIKWLIKDKARSPLIGGSGPSDVRAEKIRKDIEWRDAQIDKIKERMIPRDEHEAIVRSWAASIKTFFEQAWRRNRHHFVMQTLEQLDVLWHDFISVALDRVVGRDE